MRPDMKDLLVNTGRAAGEYVKGRRYRFKHLDPDVLPQRISTKFGVGYGKAQGDRLAPLRRFLETNCGRPWVEVFHEICKVSDHRSIRGFHLRQHVEQYVHPNNYHVGHRHSYGPFFVDVDGTLQKERPLTEAERQTLWLLNAKRFKRPAIPKAKVPNPKVTDTSDHDETKKRQVDAKTIRKLEAAIQKAA